MPTDRNCNLGSPTFYLIMLFTAYNTLSLIPLPAIFQTTCLSLSQAWKLTRRGVSLIIIIAGVYFSLNLCVVGIRSYKAQQTWIEYLLTRCMSSTVANSVPTDCNKDIHPRRGLDIHPRVCMSNPCWVH